MGKRQNTRSKRSLFTANPILREYDDGGLVSLIADQVAKGISGIANMNHQNFIKQQQSQADDYSSLVQGRNQAMENIAAAQAAKNNRIAQRQQMEANTLLNRTLRSSSNYRTFDWGGFTDYASTLSSPNYTLPTSMQTWSNPVYRQQQFNDLSSNYSRVTVPQQDSNLNLRQRLAQSNVQQGTSGSNTGNGNLGMLGTALALDSSIGSLIGGDYHTGAGDVMNKFPGLGIIGNTVNKAFGMKTNDAELNRVKGEQSYLANLASKASSASSLDDISLLDPVAVDYNVDAYKGGWFNKSEARHKNEELKKSLLEAADYVKRTANNTIQNLQENQINNMLANYAKDGGSLYTESSDTNTAIPTNNHNMRHNRLRAFGGDLMTNGATWDNGFTLIGTGGTHEENPYEGVPSGIAPDGVPNLVEEGEVIWDDYVFSKRLKVPKKFRDKYKFKDGGDISFADAAQKFAEESEERPNDPISKAGRDSLLTALMDQQEEVRMKKQAREAKAQFDSMPPEKQLGIMQMAQQQGMQEGPEKNISTVDNNPYEDMTGGQVPIMAAEGGRLGNLYKGTGSKSNRMTRKYNKDWFAAQAKALGFDLGDRFTFSNTDYDLNLTNFNELYRQAQLQKALDTYKKGQRTNWENTELASGRYKRGDNGTSIYKAKFYEDSDLGKDYISTSGTRISKEDFDKAKKEYETLKSKQNPTDEEKAKIKAFKDAKYKESVVKKGDFVRDYNGNILYDDTDISSTWSPTNDILEKGFTFDDRNAAKISYDPNIDRKWTEYLRYAPAAGGFLGLMNDVFSTPDYSRANEIKNAGSYTVPTVDGNYIGDYLTYNPLDRNYYLNQLRSSAAASRRAIANQTAGNRGAAMAGILASDYNLLGNMGKLAREAEEYNLGQKERVYGFNRTSNMFNAQQRSEAARANQAAFLQGLRDSYQGIVAGNTLMDQINARRSASISANATNILNSLGQIGEEEYDNRRIDALIKRGVLKDLYKSSNGGMLTRPKRKKGGKR